MALASLKQQFFFFFSPFLSLSLYFKQIFFVVVAVHEVLAIESATNSATVYNTKAPFPKAVSNKGFAR